MHFTFFLFLTSDSNEVSSNNPVGQVIKIERAICKIKGDDLKWGHPNPQRINICRIKICHTNNFYNIASIRKIAFEAIFCSHLLLFVSLYHFVFHAMSVTENKIVNLDSVLKIF